MPADQRGQVYKLSGGSWAYRCRNEHGKRRQVGGFKTKGEAREALDAALAVARRGPQASKRRDWTLAQLVEHYMAQHQAGEWRKANLRWLLRKATDPFGAMLVRDLLPEELGRWAAGIPEGHRFEATQALRQVLRSAVAWEIIDRDPAANLRNPQPRRTEIQPFTWEEVGAVAVEIGRYGPLVRVAAATGLRPEELLPLTWGDVDRRAAVVHVRRVYVRRKLSYQGKTPGSVPRRVPLSVRALAALDELPTSLDPEALIFLSPTGDAIDLHNWRARDWHPAVQAAGLALCACGHLSGEHSPDGCDERRCRCEKFKRAKGSRTPYALRHSFATEAIHALVPSFIIARVMGTSETMLRKHYGHLLPDTDDLVRERLNAYDRSDGGRKREEQLG